LDSYPGLAMAYSRRCRFAVTYTEGVRHKNTVTKNIKGCHSSFYKLVIYKRVPLSVAPQGTSGCILSTSKRPSRYLFPRLEQKRKSTTDFSDKFCFFVRRGLRFKKNNGSLWHLSS
jgi:hypothetical protein